MPARRSAIEKLVEAVPEVYQPVYGHPEFDDRVARRCDDRLAAIRQAIEALAPEGRRLRILDIGCSLGYVSLSLAADGHEVLGIDRQPANVALARALAAESGLAARFEVASLDESWLAGRDDGEFDLALALSVLHHTVHEKGLARTQRLVHRLLLRSRTVVAELALRREPLYWAASLPGDPLALFGRAAFVRELGRFETHLSGIRRPLVFASDRLALVAERTYAIERWSETAHEQEGGSHQSSRRYYFCEGDVLVKAMRGEGTRGDYNRQEWDNERQFLERHRGSFPFVPAWLHVEEAGRQLLSARPMWRGTLLSTLLARGIPFAALPVLRGIVGQLARLEEGGVYHRDLRAWNVVITEGGDAMLIDFGQMSAGESMDLLGTLDVHDAFWSLVHEVVTGQPNERPIPLLRRDPDALPEPWRSWMALCLDEPGPPSFARVAAHLEAALHARPVEADVVDRVRGAAAAAYERQATDLLRRLP